MKAMSMTLRPSAILVIVLTLLVGCERVRPIYEVKDRAIPATFKGLGLKEIEKRIVNAAQATHWLASTVRPGLVRATNSWRRHTAVVYVEYNANSYSIRHVSSQNLLEGIGRTETAYTGQKVIHRNYNKRVRQLESEIDRRLYSPAS